MNRLECFGRTEELEALEGVCGSRRTAMVIVYGRRRVGKTALIQKVCEERETFWYTAKAWKDEFQLELFSEALSARLGKSGMRYESWTAAFKAYAAAPGEGRRILVIDEFQHIAQKHLGFLSELRVVWDDVLSQKNFLLILLSSAVSYVEKDVLGDRSPLSGRAGIVLKVPPLSFQTVSDFAPEYAADDLVRGYAALGGIPYYWQFLDARQSMEENLALNLLRANGFLHDEPQSLLRQEFRDPSTYNAILRSIAMGASTRSEIAEQSHVDNRTLTKYLTVLGDMDLIEQEFPVFSGPNEPGSASLGRYRLNDSLQKFWFRFLADEPDLIRSQEEAQLKWKEKVEPYFAEFAHEAFAAACREYLFRWRLEGLIPEALTHFGRWWSGDAEIDIVGADKRRQHCIAAACRYRREAADLKVLRSLQKKCALLPVADDAVFSYWIFSRSGFDEALKNEAEAHLNIHLVPMKALLD